MNEETQELAAGVRAGDVLAGKYRIDRVLGVGGMGVVVAAHHLHLDDAVAIKFLLPEALKNEEAVRRFAREAQAAVRIKSEHVARVTDVGKLDNGSPYMVMEYLRGSDLSSWLEEHGRLPVEQAIEFVLQACEAIAEAHSLGIVHRDLKPANLFVIRRPDGSPSVKVLDFGISKRTGLGASGPTMTRTSAVMGSPLYMSPEQMRSARDADSRSDVWALGVILYELIGGDPPFTAESLPELVLKIVTDAPAKLRGKRPDVPEALERAIFACLEKDPVRRPQSVGALAALIAPYGPRRSAASVERISAVLRGAGTSPDTASSASSPRHQAPVDAKSANTVASWGQTASHARRGGVTAGIVAGSLLAIVASGVVGYRVFAASASKVDASATPVPPSAAVPVAPSVAPAVAPVSAARSAVEPSGTPPPSAPGKPEPPVVAPARAEQAPAPAPSAQKPVRAPRSTPRSPKPARGDVYDDRK